MLDLAANGGAIGALAQPHDCQEHELFELPQCVGPAHLHCIVEEIAPECKPRQNPLVHPDGETLRASITVWRNSPRDVQQRQLVVSIDGEKIATLMYGESVTRDLTPGEHRLRVHNTLVWKTVDLTLTAGEHANFVAVNRATWGTYAMLSLLGTGPLYVELIRKS